MPRSKLGDDGLGTESGTLFTLLRREVLGLAVGAASWLLGGEAAARARRTTKPRGVRRPAAPRGRPKSKRFRRKRKFKEQQTRLPAGFYLNRKSQVIHYVHRTARGSFFLNVDSINERRLQKMSVDEVIDRARNAARLHVHLAAASRAFELAAVEAMRARRYRQACELLMVAVKHDERLKSKLLRRPSLRLYDLLGRVAVRHENSYLRQLSNLASAAQRRLQRPARAKVGRGGSRRAGRGATRSAYVVARRQERHKRVAKARSKRKDIFKRRLKQWRSATSAWRKRVMKLRPNSWGGGRI